MDIWQGQDTTDPDKSGAVQLKLRNQRKAAWMGFNPNPAAFGMIN